MVKHIILWKLNDDIDKDEVSLKIKEGLEGLQGKIEGLLDVKVIINHLDSSTADLMLDTTFTDEQALKGYSIHPEHVKVASEIVRPNVSVRFAYDYIL